MLACCAQLGSNSAYRETLSRVRDVAEAAAAAGTGSSKEERAEVEMKKRGDRYVILYEDPCYDRV